MNLGEAAHITAASPGGSRYDEALGPSERRSAENGIWLCRTHARLVDADEVGYPVETLRAWKAGAEEEARRRLAQPDPPARASAPRVPAMLPRDDPQFTGREVEIEQLKALAHSESVRIAVIRGIAGVGKTALAVHAAHQLTSLFPDGQLYSDLHGYTEGQTAADPSEVLDLFLRQLGVPAGDIPAGIDERSAIFRSALANRRILVLLDNSNDESQVRPLLPGVGSSLVLVTSRSGIQGLVRDEQIDLRPLPESQAVEMLTKIIGPARAGSASDEVLKVARSCGMLPLALWIAGQFLNAHPRWPVSQLGRKMADEEDRLNRLEVGDRQVRATFRVSYNQLADADARVFRLLGLHFSPKFSAHSVAALANVDISFAETALSRLAEAALVNEDATEKYSLHDLMRLLAREICQSSESEETRESAEARLIGHYADLADCLDSLIESGAAEATQQALALTRDAKRGFMNSANMAAHRGLHDLTTRISESIAKAFETLGYFDDLVALQEAAVLANSGTDNPEDKARALNNVSFAYNLIERAEDAKAAANESLGIFQATGNPEGQVAALMNLGNAYCVQHDDGPAFAAYERVFDISIQELRNIAAQGGENDKIIGFGNSAAEAKANMANLAERFGLDDWEVKFYQEAIAGYKITGNLLGKGKAGSLLGRTLHRLGRYGESEEASSDALETQVATGDRYWEGCTCSTLADICIKRRDFDQAIIYLQQAASAMRAVGRDDEAARLDEAVRHFRPLGAEGWRP